MSQLAVNVAVEMQLSYAQHQLTHRHRSMHQEKLFVKDEQFMDELKQMKEMMKKLTHAIR